MKSPGWQLWLAGLLAARAAVAAGAGVDFAETVRPLLVERCYRCHGAERQEGGYRVDERAAAWRGGVSGRPALVAHQAEASPLYLRVATTGETNGHPRLKAAETRILREWINAGPAWPEGGTNAATTNHWAWQPLVRPTVPAGAGHPVDAFVRAGLAANRTMASPEADRRTLCRRLYYDLTGLPPSPADVAAFVADPGPDAYERLVDRLLASPRYGEHWARHWLDVANYADTHGNDHDFARFHAWPYRDYVIRAFNEDKPYARFVREQVAGDALYPDDPQATVALGFLAAGPWDHTLMVTVRADTVDHRTAQNLDRDSYVSTTIGTFQSLTIHCARCHAHKFDPISQREYYQLQAVFAGVDRADRPYDEEPAVFARRRNLLAELQLLRAPESAAATALLALPATEQRVTEWAAEWGRREQAWQPLEVVSVVSTGGATLTRQADGSWFASGKRPDKDAYVVTGRLPAGQLGAVRLEVLPDDRLPQHGPGRWDNGNFHLNEFRAFATTNAESNSGEPLALGHAAADFDEGPQISAAQAIDGQDETHWGIHPRYGEPHAAVFSLRTPRTFPAGALLTVCLENNAGARGHGIGRFRLAVGPGTPDGQPRAPLAAELQTISHLPPAERSPAQRRTLALAALRELDERALAALPAPQMVYAVAHDFPRDGDNFFPALQPRAIHVLHRGELDQPGELVGPAALGCVPGLPAELAVPAGADEGARRAALAQWLTDDRNVLTWRSIVNRVWAEHFGQGLCDTPNDFGHMGAAPSDPALLDWLAVWFRDEAHGSLKALHRRLLTSATWRQSSLTRQGAETDPDNRGLWRGPRRRLTGEEVRDSLLAFADRLDPTMGGPAAIQFLAFGDATFNPGGNPARLDYEHFDPDAPAARRRAVYRFQFRTVPDPLLDALDTPDGGAATPVRNVSTTAVQAFALLNDPFVIRHSTHLADRVAAGAGAEPGAQADGLFQLVLQRPADATEREHFGAYIRRHGLANAAQLLLNSNEFLHPD